MISIDPFLLLYWALALLTMPLNWLLAAAFAAGFHELCHVILVILLGGQLYSLRMRIGGAVIEASLPGRFREVLAILAGPLGSLALFFLYRFWPELAVCGVVQGIFNLLPLPHLDGGRILHGTLEGLLPEKGAAVPPDNGGTSGYW